MSDIPVNLFNFGLILALVPVCQGLVQMIKNDSMPTYASRVLSLAIGIGLTFLVKGADVQGVSELVGNPYLAILTGTVTALIASGMYNMTKNDIVKDATSSKTNTAVPTKLVNDEDKTEDRSSGVIVK